MALQAIALTIGLMGNKFLLVRNTTIGFLGRGLQDGERLPALRRQWEQDILAADPDELFTVTDAHEPMPHQARLHASVTCAKCGEAAMETLVRKLGVRDLCIPCFNRAHADI